MHYDICRVDSPAPLDGAWSGSFWRSLPAVDIAWFHPDSAARTAQTQAKLAYDQQNLYGHFQVRESHVICTHTQPQSSVCSDSCVELFIQPDAHRQQGYFNFEINCGGTMLLHWSHHRCTEKNVWARQWQCVDPQWMDQVRIYHSLPKVINPPLEGPITWNIEFSIPWALMQAYAGPLDPLGLFPWRANLFKCSYDVPAQRHWASWTPLGRALCFHQTRYFGEVRFLDRATPAQSCDLVAATAC